VWAAQGTRGTAPVNSRTRCARPTLATATSRPPALRALSRTHKEHHVGWGWCGAWPGPAGSLARRACFVFPIFSFVGRRVGSGQGGNACARPRALWAAMRGPALVSGLARRSSEVTPGREAEIRERRRGGLQSVLGGASRREGVGRWALLLRQGLLARTTMGVRRRSPINSTDDGWIQSIGGSEGAGRRARILSSLAGCCSTDKTGNK
jgi:hypothetical protein